ncbi:hypothetical protein KC217_20575, partial [Mycobacterium tuberculosis]|nr:hypothetical protein [Mycobacterium tuberculosis]
VVPLGTERHVQQADGRRLTDGACHLHLNPSIHPGGADTPEATWELLASGRDATTPRPATRWSEWSGDAYVQQVLSAAPDRGGWLDDAEVRD